MTEKQPESQWFSIKTKIKIGLKTEEKQNIRKG